MKIGVFLGIGKPEDGGGTSLLYTIKNELEQHGTTHEFVFIYYDEKDKKYKTESDGMVIINIYGSSCTSVDKISK